MTEWGIAGFRAGNWKLRGIRKGLQKENAPYVMGRKTRYAFS
jgi:hypothetical protein